MVMRVVYNKNTLEIVQGYDPAKKEEDLPFPAEAVPIEDYAQTDVPGDAKEMMRTLHPDAKPTRKKFVLTPDLQEIIPNPDYDDPLWSISQITLKIEELENRLGTLEAKES